MNDILKQQLATLLGCSIEEVVDRVLELFDITSVNELPKCEVRGCEAEAEYEGWYRVVDGLNIPTGLIQRRQVCVEHRNLLIGSE